MILLKWPGISAERCDHVGILDEDGLHTIEGNTSPDGAGSQNDGGGVYVSDGASLFLTDTVITNNKAGNTGGGIAAECGAAHSEGGSTSVTSNTPNDIVTVGC